MRQLLNVFALLLSKFKANAFKKLIPLTVLNKIKVANYCFLLYYDIFFREEKRTFPGLISNLALPRKRVLFYPHIPWESSMVIYICIQRRYRVTDSISRRPDLIMKWDPATYAPSSLIPEKLKALSQVINYACTDISKSHAAEIFKAVFGYELTVNPLVYRGKCVQKSNINAQHDGQIIECPIDQLQPDFVYQVLIDNEAGDGLVLDMRVPVFGDFLPFILFKYQPAIGRFHAGSVRQQIVETSDAISHQEQGKILEFCRLMGLDYGELDVLRDRNDGRIYIVDVNPTPHGYPVHYAIHLDPNMRQVVQRQAEAFSMVFMEGA